MSCVEVVSGAEMAERKHSREEDEAQGSSASKRFRGLSPEVEELIHFLEDAEEEGCVAEEIVCSVMKSFEEEIINSCCSTENEIRTRDVGKMGCGVLRIATLTGYRTIFCMMKDRKEISVIVGICMRSQKVNPPYYGSKNVLVPSRTIYYLSRLDMRCM
ncbi:uncharacterized protein LOC131859533 [Cryptomeria japonica]|uniref:uncharacterized protein LOC131859533 n=1 Tax=Cryptomeria japonica TaxID=3369 RepID=UPI0027DA35F8|nr:uncharacterized protein LOC131859533 [Cryptomeria japonica]